MALLIAKSPMAIAGLLGIYKAGGIAVPLDPAGPARRLAHILDVCEPRCLLAGGAVTSMLDMTLHSLCGPCPAIGWLEGAPPDPSLAVAFAPPALDGCGDEAQPPRRTQPHDPAHIVFTSGSTGAPKGVVITHASVVHLVRWATAHFGIDASDRLSGHPPLYFDMFHLDLFCAAAAGAELHLVPPELNALPTRLADFIRTAALTQWFSVPSVLTYLAGFDVIAHGDFPALRRVLWAGDVLPTPTLIHWMRRLPHVGFTNLYGPTETTIVSSHYTVPACPTDPREPIPIGAACDGEALHVLDGTMQPVPRGETGELWLSGLGLARGYWRDPERTASAFGLHPQWPAERLYRTGDLARVGADGLVYFLGRRDAQVKHRGYRIELGEIEAALSTIAGLRDCAVIALPVDSFEGATICCAYAPAPGGATTPGVLRRALHPLVPDYMIPAYWVSLDRLPTTASGKVDRRGLRTLFTQLLTYAHAAPASRHA